MEIVLASARRSPFTGEAISAPHQGLLSLAASLRAGTFGAIPNLSVQVVDDQLELLKDPDASFGAWLGRCRPDVIGVQTTTSSLKSGVALLAEARRRFPGVVTVLGGVGPTPIAHRLVSDDAADVVVRGEGEATFACLLRSLDEHGRAGFAKVAGISFRTQAGAVVDTPPRPSIAALDGLPLPARDLVDMASYRRISRGRCGNLITSRGCSYACAYCYSRHQWGVGQRRFPVERALAEVEELVREYGLERVRIEDDDFTEDREWVVAFCDGIVARGLHTRVEWEAKGRPEHVEPELGRRMRAAGCMRLLTGIETLDEQLLRRMSRPLKVETLERAIHLLHGLGIGVQGTMILGIPGETDAAMRCTLEWLSERLTCSHDIVSPCFFVPFYDEIAQAMRRRLPFTIEVDDTEQYTGHVPVTSSEACSFDELWTLYRDMTPNRRGVYDRIAHLATTSDVQERMAYHH